MNPAKQLIKQAIRDDHLLKFTTPDEQYNYYGKTTNYYKALELLKDVDCQCLIKLFERVYAHKKPHYMYINQWVICNPYPDQPEESVIDYPCNGYVDNWFKKMIQIIFNQIGEKQAILRAIQSDLNSLMNNNPNQKRRKYAK